MMEEHLDLPLEVERPFIVWLFQALGLRYTIFLPFIALLAFILAAIAVWRFKTPLLTALLLVVVPLPFFYGAMATIDGLMASWQVVTMSGAAPKPSELAEGGAMSLLSMQVGLVLSLPVYILSAIALAFRAFSHSEANQATLNSELPIGAAMAPMK
jgi:hypothetical protein